MASHLVRQRGLAVLALARGKLPLDGLGHAAAQQAEQGRVVAIAVRGFAAGRGAVARVHAGRGWDLDATVFAEPHGAILAPRSVAT